MSQAEAARLGANLSGAVSGGCGDLARWLLERNCVSPAPGLDFGHLGRLDQHQQRAYYGHGANLSLQQAAAASLASSQHESHILGVGELAGGEPRPLTQFVAGYLLEPTHQLEAKLDYLFSDVWLASGDQRTNRLPFVGASPWKLIYATLIYLYLIKVLLPRVMRPFRPLSLLNWPIRLYNLAMVVFNMWSFYHSARILQFGVKCFGCETIDHQDHSAQAIELLHYGWLFFMSRLVEWLDTIFFVLRKKDRQVTKLHVFHHSFVPLISWTYLKYHPGYTMAFFPFINTLVHSIMYTYYLLATFGPRLQPYLWWKRYLTSLQILQFVLILIQLASIPLTGDETCQYPRGFLYVAIAGAILFLWLFYTYYLDTYTRGKQRPALAESCARGAAAGRGRPTGSQREGSSRSLSDAVDNAIGCGEECKIKSS